MIRKDILDKALALTMGDRNKQYGDPTMNHANIAAMWNAYMGVRANYIQTLDDILFDAEDVMLMMALLKIARLAQRLGDDGSRVDSVMDAVNYIAMTIEVPHDK